MPRLPTRIEIDADTKAEGQVNGFAYDTQIVSVNGCALHLWSMTDTKPDREHFNRMVAASNSMGQHRDIVERTWSVGYPAGYWADSNF